VWWVTQEPFGRGEISLVDETARVAGRTSTSNKRQKASEKGVIREKDKTELNRHSNQTGEKSYRMVNGGTVTARESLLQQGLLTPYASERNGTPGIIDL